MDIRIILIGALAILIIYMLHKLREDPLASQIKKEIFLGINNEVFEWLERYHKLMHSEGKRVGEKADLLQQVLQVFVGFGSAFEKALKARKFYFRELLMMLGSVGVARAWIRSALEVGIIVEKKDGNGVTYYEVSADGIKSAGEVIIRALEELL